MNFDKDGGPAFPWGEHGTHLGGMSIRDVFATHAPAPPAWWMKQFATKAKDLDSVADCITQWNYVYADSMLKARLK